MYFESCFFFSFYPRQLELKRGELAWTLFVKESVEVVTTSSRHGQVVDQDTSDAGLKNLIF